MLINVTCGQIVRKPFTKYYRFKILDLLLKEGENRTTDVIALATVKGVPLWKMTLCLGAQIKPLVKLILAIYCFQGHAEFHVFLRGGSAN